MDFEKSEKIFELLDAYKELLTEKQQQIMDDYFTYDLSLSEIAENNSISRAAVSDLIKRVSVTLEEYEGKLHLVYKKKEIEKIIENLDESIKEQIEKIL